MNKVYKLYITLIFVSISFSQIFFSEYAEGSSNNKYLEVFNAGSQSVDLSGYAYPSTANAPDVPGEYEYWNGFENGAIIDPGDVYVICHGSADDFIQAECDETHTYLSNGDDGYCLVEGTESSFTIIDCIGDWYADPGDGWDVAGISNGTKDHTLVRKSTVLSGNFGDWSMSAGTNENDSEWLIYDQNTWDYLGYHTTDNSGETYGCMDNTACNFNPDATVDNDSCTYPEENYDCDGNCLVDVDECGICGGNATADECSGDIFFSEYAEGSSNHKYLEIYNATGSTIDLSNYAFPNATNGADTFGMYDYWNTFDEGAFISPGDVYVICHGSADDFIQAECDQTHTYLSNGDDGFCLVEGTESSFTILDCIGDWGDDPGSGWSVAGVSNATKDHTLVRQTSVTSGNYGDWNLSAGTNASNSEWVVFDQNTWTYLGSHPHEFGDIAGCMDPGAANYNPNATSDDGSCEYAQAVTIQEIQGTSDVSPILGQIVQTSGIVTGVSYSGFFIQDGTGPWSGLWIYISSPSVEVGDLVQVSGEVAEYNGLTEIVASNFSILSSGNNLPEATLISTGSLSEEYEGVRVKFLNALCIESPNDYGEWTVNDGSGIAVVDDRLSEPEVDIYNNFTYDVTGVVDCYNEFKLQATQIDFEEGQNIPPSAVAGEDLSVNFGDVVILDASSSYDSDGTIVGYYWTQEQGLEVFYGEPESPVISFIAPDEFTILVFSLQVTDDLGLTSTDSISITVGEPGAIDIVDIINNCNDDLGDNIQCSGSYDLSSESASECPLYGQSITTTGVIIDYFDITPWNGPHSFTIQDTDGNQLDFVVWPESSSYQDGFDITQTDLNVLTDQSTFGTYAVEITGELGGYCDDDELLDIYSEWQITVEYEYDISIIEYNEEDLGCTDPNAPNYDPNATIDDGSCEFGSVDIIDIINNCSDELGENIECDGSYDLSFPSAAACPLYEQSITTTGVVVDYFDITPFNGPHSFTIQDSDGNLLDFVVWPESSFYQDGFDITQTDLNVLTQLETFGLYEVTITGELGVYCGDDELLDIYSEWQITVEYEDNITINNGEGQNIPPTAVAGEDISVNYGDVVILDASSSYDSDGNVESYYWTQEQGIEVFFGEPESPIISFIAPDEFTTIVFSLQITDDLGATSIDFVSITVGEIGMIDIIDIINNCDDGLGNNIQCSGQYDLSPGAAFGCPLYGQSLTTTGVVVDYFDITPYNGPHSFTIQDMDGNQLDFVVWPESSSYQDGFDITQTELDVLTNPETFGTYEVEIRGELGAYCDDDELLDIYSEWQITVEYEDDITILNGQECTPNGDINEDGITNVIDIVQMVNSILDDSIELTDYQICLLDLNTDGLVNVIDIVSLVNLILES